MPGPEPTFEPVAVGAEGLVVVVAGEGGLELGVLTALALVTWVLEWLGGVGFPVGVDETVASMPYHSAIRNSNVKIAPAAYCFFPICMDSSLIGSRECLNKTR